MSRLLHLCRDRSGAAAVEAAFTLPLLLSVLLGTMEVGRLAWTQAALNFAVQEAARCADVQTTVCGTPAATAAYASQKTAPLTIPASAFTVTTTTCGVQVKASYAYSFMVRAIAPVTPTLTAQVCRP